MNLNLLIFFTRVYNAFKGNKIFAIGLATGTCSPKVWCARRGKLLWYSRANFCKSHRGADNLLKVGCARRGKLLWYSQANFCKSRRAATIFPSVGCARRGKLIWCSRADSCKSRRVATNLGKSSVKVTDDPKKTKHLRSLEGADERLHLLKANLLEEGSFDAAVDGCEGVFHTASPFLTTVKDPQAELIGPALKGTLNVLGSCAKASSIRRVVVTSSFVAVAYNGRPLTSDVLIDETWFSDAKYCTEVQDWYSLSKTLAEEAAWKFASENSIDIVTINPAMVIGPLLQPTLNTSAASILSLINAPTFPNATYGWVNVKNVVEAHILAFEVPSASGRYCLVESAVHFSELVKILKECFPDYNLPEKCADEKPFDPIFHVSKDKAEKLGINFIPLEVSIKETVESLKAKNFIKF